jgi:hypothetical protein
MTGERYIMKKKNELNEYDRRQAIRKKLFIVKCIAVVNIYVILSMVRLVIYLISEI